MTTLLPSRLTRRIAITLSSAAFFAVLEGCDAYNCSQCHNFASASAKLVSGNANVNSISHARMGPKVVAASLPKKILTTQL